MPRSEIEGVKTRKGAAREDAALSQISWRSGLEVEPNSNLALAARQTLKGAPKDRRSTIEALHSSDIAFVEEIEEFEQHLCPHPLSNVESLRQPSVHVHESRRSVTVPGKLWELTGKA